MSPTNHEHGAHEHDDHHDHGDHAHEAPRGLRGLIASIFGGHAHGVEGTVDRVLESSSRGMTALKISLLGLAATALFQLLIVVISGSVALLADTIHNFGDAVSA